MRLLLEYADYIYINIFLYTHTRVYSSHALTHTAHKKKQNLISSHNSHCIRNACRAYKGGFLQVQIFCHIYQHNLRFNKCSKTPPRRFYLIMKINLISQITLANVLESLIKRTRMELNSLVGETNLQCAITCVMCQPTLTLQTCRVCVWMWSWMSVSLINGFSCAYIYILLNVENQYFNHM